MTHREIRDHIFITLARLFDDPLHRKQYYRFTFAGADEQAAEHILTELLREDFIEQTEPGVVRLTETGYKKIQPELNLIANRRENRHTDT